MKKYIYVFWLSLCGFFYQINAMDCVTKSSDPPLHCAVQTKNVEKVNRLLQDKDININEVSQLGMTPLCLAIQANNLGMVKLLIACATIDINAKNKCGFSPLHFAVNNNNVEIVRLLIKKKANVNAQNADGNTPLHLVVVSQCLINKAIVVLLLSCEGININIKNNMKQTPLDIAQQDTEIESLLSGRKKMSVIAMIGTIGQGRAVSDKPANPIPTDNGFGNGRGSVNLGEKKIIIVPKDHIVSTAVPLVWKKYLMGTGLAVAFYALYHYYASGTESGSDELGLVQLSRLIDKHNKQI